MKENMQIVNKLEACKWRRKEKSFPFVPNHFKKNVTVQTLNNSINPMKDVHIYINIYMCVFAYTCRISNIHKTPHVCTNKIQGH